ncbi:hypothetical protein PV10_08070 [Exophiala mesophila]|uniref:Uncharacterized protein n=1 Tax=Exophiala mesophila TaxID=212818 RepID=A0A0D1ZNK8_EXOME|nr:uncharacterized protein PV10_08070 [Exophiala mesophila]KIV88383.1 hypothetical protein PV10_08070 [Exophiala mesophila]
MATTRLRKTFHYPDDDDSHGSHDEMDEEEQETLLTNLSTRETKQNKQYVMIFSVLPLVVMLAFLRVLGLSTSRAMTLACILSITSLLLSAYIMYFVPIGTPLFAIVTKTAARFGIGSRDSASHPHPQHYSQQPQQRIGQRQLFTIPSLTKSAPPPPDLDTPLALVLPYFNAFICALLALVALRYRASTNPDIPQGLWMVFLLPAVVFLVVLVIRNSIDDIQSGLGELRGLKYDFKGA